MRLGYLSLFLCVVSSLGCSSTQPATDASLVDHQELGVDAGMDVSDDAPEVSDGGSDVVQDSFVEENVFTPLAVNENWTLMGLTSPVHVVRTAANIPHIYASNPADLARVHGFTTARDRFFFMDMTRRLALGTVSRLLGEAALSNDMDSRVTGLTFVAQKILEGLTPEQASLMDNFAAGVNAYITQVRSRRATAPTEYELAALLFGRRSPADLMQDFTRQDMAAIFATFVYQLGFETEDVSRGRADLALDTSFAGSPLQDLRRAGARRDVFEQIRPMMPTSSSAGFGLEMAEQRPTNRSLNLQRALARTSPQRSRGLSREVLDRLSVRMEAFERRLRRVEGFGSNAWAVNRQGTTDGSSVIASDGHLPLTIPALFYQVALDTQVLGNGSWHMMGVTIPGLPTIAVGTNGSVAWGETQLGGDITDWYNEEIVLDSNGLPSASRFNNTTRPLQRTDEMFMVADIPALNSMGRSESWPRFTTFDGRFITEIEGRRVTATETINPGETKVMVSGGLVVPSDTNNDGRISAVSFDYTGLDGGNLLGVYINWGQSRDVQEFRQHSRGLIAASQNYVASDSTGSIYYTSYQTVPCRDYLPRNPDRTWIAGADPTKLLDGTRYGGFRIPITNGVVDETPGMTDPYACVVPFAQMPAALDPSRGYVLTANNDIGNISTDNSLVNDPFYVGGPWLDGYRAHRIDQQLRATVMSRSGTEDAMSTLQGDTRSPIGEDFLAYLLDAIDVARTASQSPQTPGTALARLATLFQTHQTDYDTVQQRLQAWRDRGFRTPSGVETFYHTPASGDRDDAVAVTIFNAWFGRVLRGVFDDEPFPSGVASGRGKLRTLRMILQGRGPTNSMMLASYNTATGESAFFDVISTPDIETSHEVILQGLNTALTFLRSAPTAPGRGGFGSNDMNTWLWGLRHHVQFRSILSDFIGDDPMLAFVTDRFTISPRQLPLMPNLPMGDPRAELPGFPRPGDQFCVDAADPGLDGEDFTFGSGPNFRMVIKLGPNGVVSGRNILPGGQSGIPASMYFSDQAALWLGNQTLPMLFRVQDVISGAIRHEVFRP